MKSHRKSAWRNERGVLTLDFIFAMTIGMSFAMIFFALTLTLSLVEVTQYVSFSVARTAWGAHETRQQQAALGDLKYAELMDRPVFKAVFGKNWFALGRPQYGDPVNGFNTEYPEDPAEDNATYFGARIRIEAKILDINIPMLGRSKTKPETGTANVQTFLGREVTTEECREQFNRNRWAGIQALSSAYTPPGDPNIALFVMTDNGC
jgi:hypothetical protein